MARERAMRMFRRLLRAPELACVLGALAVHVPHVLLAQGLPASDQSYHIVATLDPRSHCIDATQTIRFKNHSSRALHELYFHLYLNAFRDRRSVFMREGGAGLRGEPLRSPGFIELRGLRGRRRGQDPDQDRDQGDLLASAQRELIAGDRTQLRVRLPEALPAGDTLELSLTFHAQLPELVARSGYVDEFHLVAQWFPKLARLEPDGRWASFPYHGLGEFYADFADYDVELRVPSAYVVGATGVLAASTQHAGMRSDHFSAHAVHDFAFSAYPYFERTRSTQAGVELIMLAPRGYTAAVTRQRRVIEAGLREYAARFGPYPYTTLTVVLPPAAAQAAAGMEYPTFFVSAGPWWAAPERWPDPVHDSVAAHELAHQWFSGMLASDETSAPALDEGLAQWATLVLLRRLYGRPPSVLAGFSKTLDAFDVAHALYLRRSEPVPSSLLAVSAYRIETLARAVYLRPALVLDALGARYGRTRIDTVLGNYARTERFQHPGYAELYAAFDRQLGASFSGQQLRPALTADGALLHARPAQPASPSARPASFFADALFALQALLQGLGP